MYCLVHLSYIPYHNISPRIRLTLIILRHFGNKFPKNQCVFYTAELGLEKFRLSISISLFLAFEHHRHRLQLFSVVQPIVTPDRFQAFEMEEQTVAKIDNFFYYYLGQWSQAR